MTESKRERGIEKFKEVYCNALPEPPKEGEDRFFDFMLGSLFGDLWDNETLSIRDRRLLLLGAIAAQGEDMTFTIQAQSAFTRGELDEAQLEEAVLFLTQYIGYPRASKMRMALMGLMAKIKKQEGE
ncbi:carboxymuconolactone decarboxylase family protein [Spongiibacter marinus]|jgi:4-carboxymuconolactone decarboxylase|uniref:carboxymuconolactone decarboxylase family protein n=1 Tax=Spongiibacter marinus TaxID=354246 RepID=UPI000415BCBF|nr:carboxymuconolactone decarboxylase family protein [Spongiibacter marinus]MEE2651729.1 carboxymuconolactone decarboxylase family protein [Pseudomonadota bacterium]